MKINKLSVIVPAYNERATIEEILRRIRAADFGPVEREIIVVDDGSQDGTREILEKYQKDHKIIFHPKNQGKGAAVRTGFLAASGDFLVVQDADLEYDPNDFKAMLALAAQKDAGVVYGSRRLGAAKGKNPKAGLFYHIGGTFLTRLTNFLYGTNITDEPTCYKMFRADIFKKIGFQSNGFEWEPEITAKISRLKIPIYETPISYTPRSKQAGKKIRLKDGLIAIWTLIKYRFWP